MVSTTTSNATSGTKSTQAHPASAHPLDPLTAAEIRQAVAAVRAHMDKGEFAGAPAKPLFNSVAIKEPPKYDLLNWAGIFTPKEIAAVSSAPIQPVKRQADVSVGVEVS